MTYAAETRAGRKTVKRKLGTTEMRIFQGGWKITLAFAMKKSGSDVRFKTS